MIVAQELPPADLLMRLNSVGSIGLAIVVIISWYIIRALLKGDVVTKREYDACNLNCDKRVADANAQAKMWEELYKREKETSTKSLENLGAVIQDLKDSVNRVSQ